MTHFLRTMALDLLRQTTISEAGYAQYLSPSDHKATIDRGLQALGLTPPLSFNCGNTDNKLCEWLGKTAWIEPTLYDHVVPVDSVLPMSMFPDDLPWTALTWCFDPYDTPVPYPELGSQFYDKTLEEKAEPYLMKSMVFNHIELSWICYNRFDTIYFLHHNQIRGTMRDRISRSDQVWCHRYMLRMFAEMVPTGSTIVIPESRMLNKYQELHPEYVKIPMTPFSHHVVGKSKFAAIDGTALCQQAPHLHDVLHFTNELPSADQQYWVRTT